MRAGTMSSAREQTPTVPNVPDSPTSSGDVARDESTQGHSQRNLPKGRTPSTNNRIRELQVSVVAAFISFCALALSVWEGYETRNHDRITVVPKLSFSGDTSRLGPFGISLTNNGSGPALIEWFAVAVDGVLMDESDHYGGLLNALSRLDINESWVYVYRPDKG